MNGIVAADVNNDGYVDIVTVSSSNNEIRVFINSGTGTFSGGGVSYASTGTAPNKIAIADINKDGRPDVIVSNSTSNNYTVFQNSGTGTFSTTSTVSSGALTAPSGVILSDINNDGYPDLIFTTSGSTAVSAMKNNAGGGYTFGAKSDYTTGAGPTAVAAADVNNDGKVDLAVSNGTANSVSILLNSGTGAFGAKTDYAVAAAPSVIAFADFNNDNKPDIVELSNTNSLHSVLLNSGTGTFANRIDLSTPGSNAQSNIAFTDLNRDGYTDIVAGIGSFAQFYVFTNQMNATVTSTGLANNSIVVNGQGYFQTTTDTTAALQVQNSTGTNIFNVDTTNQRVGILNSAPSYALHVGSATVTSGTTVARFQNAGGTCDITPNIAGGITCTSDLRFKKNITDYSGALAKLSSLRTVNYNLNSEADGSQMHVGFIAQELEAILPDLVLTDADGYKSVSYAGLTPYLVAALQEQQTQISALQSSVGLINGGTINGSLNVTGAVTLGGGLSVTGDVSITGNLTVIDLIAENITINGHVITGGSVPAVTSGTATGTGATATIEGNDTSGKITVVAGTSTTAGELAKVNFNKPFSAKPRIVIAPANSDAAGLNAFYDDSATTTDSFAVWAKNNLEAGKTYIFTYWANQ
jgi:hypothetical protein